MQVLIDDGMQIQLGTGIGKYSQYLYTSLLALKEHPDDHFSLENFQRDTSEKAKSRAKYLFYINSKKYFRKLSHYDIVHYTNYAMPLIKNPKTKYVVTIHDLASFICPETLPKLYVAYNKIIIRHALKRADAIVTVSYSVKKEIERLFPQFIEKVNVIYPGLYNEIKKSDLSEKYENCKLNQLDKRKFFLFVGTIEKRKNIGIIIKAFLQLKSQDTETRDYKLVLCGRPGYGYNEYYEMATSSAYSKDIVFTGYVTSNDCNKLYNNALTYIFPSIYEGFGSIQTECMNCHLLLILSDIPTNREISNNYALFFKLGDVDSLVEQMQYVTHGNFDVEAAAQKADELIQIYDWNKIVKRYMELYNSVL